MILIIAGVFGALVTLCLYACLVVASREDDAMEEYFKSIDKAGR